MAKRSRGGSRPGQRRPRVRGPQRATRPAGGSLAAPIPSLTAAEEASAADYEAQLLAAERTVSRDRDRPRDRARDAGSVARTRTRDGGLLATRAAEEYSYVARDMRRIVLLDGALLGVLAVLFVLISVVGVIRL